MRDVVNHFRHEQHRLGRLHDLVVALVSGQQLRRAVGDAAFREGSIFRTPGWPAHPCERSRAALLSIRRQGGHFPVGRVGDERGPVLPNALHDPDGTVVAGLAIGALETCFRSLHIRPDGAENLVAERGVAITAEQFMRLLPQGRHFLVGQSGSPGQFRRAAPSASRCCWPRIPGDPDVRRGFEAASRFV